MGKPNQTVPDYAAATKDAVYTDLEMLPLRRLIDAASQMGTTATGPDGKTYDYTGMGTADIGSQYADRMAQVLLELQQEHGADYVKQRLNELQLSDPEGQAARKQLYQQLQTQLATPPNTATAQAAQDSALALLQQGGTLDAATTREVEQGVRSGQAGRGNVLGNAAVAQEAGAVAGQAERSKAARQEQAMQILTAGVSPEDVRYRRAQQAMGDLSSFVAGTTPEAQFSGVASAGNGATPFLGTSTQFAGVNANAAGAGASDALRLYTDNVNWQQVQANPYWAGIGLGARAYGLYRAATPAKTTPPASANNSGAWG